MLLSVHIPKTAGSSFTQVLTQAYGRGLVRDYDDLVLDPQAPFHCQRDVWARNTAAFVEGHVRPGAKVIHGHYSATKYKDRFPQTCWVTWLRQPISRLISHYYFWTRLPLDPEHPHSLHREVREGRMSFAEFIEAPTIPNAASRIFLQGLRLEDIDFVGIQEHFDQDLMAAQRQFGWPAVQTRQENPNPSPGYREAVAAIKNDRSLMRRMEELNKEDLALYESALRRRSKSARTKIVNVAAALPTAGHATPARIG